MIRMSCHEALRPSLLRKHNEALNLKPEALFVASEFIGFWMKGFRALLLNSFGFIASDEGHETQSLADPSHLTH